MNALPEDLIHDHDDGPPNLTLAEWLDEDLAPDDVEQLDVEDDDIVSPRFRLMSERAAVWAMRKLADRQARIDEHNRTANAEIERIRAWQDTVNGPLANDTSFFNGLLVEWHANRIGDALGTNPMRGPVDADAWKKFKAKSHKLPNGDIGARIGTGRFEAVDAEAAVVFLTQLGRTDLLHIEPKVAARDLDAAADGEQPAVMTVLDGEVARYFVQLDKLPVGNEEAERVHAAVQAGALNAEEILEAFALTDAFRDTTPYHVDALEVRVTQQLGQPAQVELWVQIPGVRKTGVGIVTLAAKPNVEVAS